MPVSISILQAEDIRVITEKPSFLNRNAMSAYLQKLLDAQGKDEIVFLVAHEANKIAGFLYVVWKPEYLPFAEAGIPEIKDLRVLPEYRWRGIATALMDEAERRIFERFPSAGLGVGLYADYGPAQRMYIKRGYNFDGRGLTYNNQPVKPGRDVFVDDELVIYLIKERP